MTNETRSGKLTLWLTNGPEERVAVDVCSALTAEGERLLVIDADGCRHPSRLSRATVAVAKSMEVLRVSQNEEFHAAAQAAIHAARQRGPLSRVLLLGLLDRLSARQVLTRETARALGRMKQSLEAMMDCGVDVTILCPSTSGLGARPYLVSSLCAFADEIRRPGSDSQQDVERAAAAIA